MEEEEKSKSHQPNSRTSMGPMITKPGGQSGGAWGLLDLGLPGYPFTGDQHGPHCQEVGWQAGLLGPVAFSHCLRH